MQNLSQKELRLIAKNEISVATKADLQTINNNERDRKSLLKSKKRRNLKKEFLSQQEIVL